MVQSEVELSSIKLSDKFRVRVDAPVADLEESIEACGLISPLMVNRNLELIAGGRRYTALKKLGWTRVPVVFMDGSDIDAQIANVDENLMRRDFKPKERVVWVNRRFDLYCQKYPARKKAREEWEALDHSDLETDEEFAAYDKACEEGTERQFEIDRAAGKFKRNVRNPSDGSIDENVDLASKRLKIVSPDFSEKFHQNTKTKKSRGRPTTQKAEFVKESAKATGLTEETFRNDLKLKEQLIPEAFAALTSGEISMAHGKKLARLEKIDQLSALKVAKIKPAKALDKKKPENHSKTFLETLDKFRNQLQFQSAIGGTFEIKERSHIEKQIKLLETDLEFFKQKLWGIDRTWMKSN